MVRALKQLENEKKKEARERYYITLEEDQSEKLHSRERDPGDNSEEDPDYRPENNDEFMNTVMCKKNRKSQKLHEIETAVGVQLRGLTIKQYLIKWKGYTRLSWTHARNMDHCKELTDEFNAFLRKRLQYREFRSFVRSLKKHSDRHQLVREFKYPERVIKYQSKPRKQNPNPKTKPRQRRVQQNVQQPTDNEPTVPTDAEPPAPPSETEKELEEPTVSTNAEPSAPTSEPEKELEETTATDEGSSANSDLPNNTDDIHVNTPSSVALDDCAADGECVSSPVEEGGDTPNTAPVETIASDGRFKCSADGCTFSSPYKQTVKRHEKTGKHKSVSVGKKTFECLICNAMLSTKQNLAEHISVVHNAPAKAFACAICSKTFKSNKQRLDHAASHAEKVNCMKCGAGIRKKHMKQHLKTCSTAKE